MSNFTVADVKRLRELTAAGMMDCKNALQDADGNFDRAVEILRIKGAKDVGKRAERTASNGLVTVALDGTTTGALLELNCETDFVAKTEAFQALAFQVTEFAVQNKPSDVPSLLAAEIVPGTTVQQLLDEANATLGEKIEIRRFALLEAPYLATYLHKSDPSLPPSTGVLLALSTTDAEVGKETFEQLVDAVQRCVDAGRFIGDTTTMALQIWSLAHGVVALQLAHMLDPEQAVDSLRAGGANLFRSFGEARAPVKRR